MGWNYLSISKLQRLHRWSLEMHKLVHPTLRNGCDYLSIPGLTLNHVSEKGPQVVSWHVTSTYPAIHMLKLHESCYNYYFMHQNRCLTPAKFPTQRNSCIGSHHMNIQTTRYLKSFKAQNVLQFPVNSFMIYEMMSWILLGKCTGSRMLIPAMHYAIRRGF